MRFLLGVLILVVAGTCSGAARAQSCTFGITNMTFGNIDVTANAAVNTTATFTANCTGTKNKIVRICPNISTGTGGSATGNPRELLSGSNQLNFNLFQNSTHTTVWGSYLWPFSGTYTAPTVNITLNSSGSGSTTKTIYGQVAAAQQTTPAGTYTSSFAGAQTTIAYAYSTVGTCAVIGSTNGIAAPFTVTATNVTQCSVSSTAVNFGTAGVLQSNVDATGTVSLTCTNAAPYTISLNGGNAGATDPTLRKLASGANQITYGLYQDAARTLPWGSTAGTNTQAGTGTGLSQTYTVYGRVPPQTTPAPATYSDTVVATITY